MSFTKVTPPALEFETVMGFFNYGDVVALFPGEGQYVLKEHEDSYYEFRSGTHPDLRAKFDHSLGLIVFEELP